jgi:hypothetical protein
VARSPALRDPTDPRISYDSQLHRYPAFPNVITSALEKDRDLINLVSGLRSHSVLADILRQRHAFTAIRQINDAAFEIKTYIKQGLRFLEQARNGPSGVSYLPYYYSFLQFAKAVTVARGRSAQLHKRLHHGLSYDPDAKDSRTPLTEFVRIYRDGVFPTYYETLTGTLIPDFRHVRNRNKRTPVMTISMADVYPYVYDIASELMLATKNSPPSRVGGYPFQPVRLMSDQVDPQRVQIILRVQSFPSHPAPIQQPQHNLPITSGFRPSRMAAGQLYLGPIRQNAPPSKLCEGIRTYLLYVPTTTDINDFYYLTPRWNGRLQLPEEVPIFLMFFHLGSVIRYKPGFYDKLAESGFYPMLLAAERYCTFKFLLLFYSAMMQQSHFIL